MHKLISFNREILNFDEANIGGASASALYGYGIFTTIAVYDGEPFLWAKHWRRLQNTASKLGVDISSHSEESICGSLSRLLAANAVKQGRARITFFDGSPRGVWSYGAERKASALITTGDLRAGTGDFNLTLSPFSINSGSPIAGLKTCNYMERINAFDEAKCRGFSEAVQLNQEGNIASACMSNIFWTEGEKLFTPSLETGCVPGTTREFVMENLECLEAQTTIVTLDRADAIFLTSNGIGVRRVSRYDGRELRGTDHPILSLIG